MSRKFKVVVYSDADRLEQDVSQFLDAGFDLHGDMKMIYRGDASQENRMYAQALVKHAKHEKHEKPTGTFVVAFERENADGDIIITETRINGDMIRGQVTTYKDEHGASIHVRKVSSEGEKSDAPAITCNPSPIDFNKEWAKKSADRTEAFYAGISWTDDELAKLDAARTGVTIPLDFSAVTPIPDFGVIAIDKTRAKKCSTLCKTLKALAVLTAVATAWVAWAVNS